MFTLNIAMLPVIAGLERTGIRTRYPLQYVRPALGPPRLRSATAVLPGNFVSRSVLSHEVASNLSRSRRSTRVPPERVGRTPRTHLLLRRHSRRTCRCRTCRRVGGRGLRVGRGTDRCARPSRDQSRHVRSRTGFSLSQVGQPSSLVYEPRAPARRASSSGSSKRPSITTRPFTSTTGTRVPNSRARSAEESTSTTLISAVREASMSSARSQRWQPRRE
jgi:hypothetical protein